MASPLSGHLLLCESPPQAQLAIALLSQEGTVEPMDTITTEEATTRVAKCIATDVVAYLRGLVESSEDRVESLLSELETYTAEVIDEMKAATAATLSSLDLPADRSTPDISAKLRSELRETVSSAVSQDAAFKSRLLEDLLATGPEALLAEEDTADPVLAKARQALVQLQAGAPQEALRLCDQIALLLAG